MRCFCALFTSVLSLLFILSCLTVALGLNSTQAEIMKTLSARSPVWEKNASNPDPCQWAGVNCSVDKNDVVELHLRSLGINSSFWHDVCKLQALRVLDLSNNSVSAPSEGNITSCTSLVSLNLSSNAMSGFLPSLNPLHKLQSLDVSHNNLTGEITAPIQNLTELTTFIGTYNNFDGSAVFGGVKLEKVDVSHNHFGGGFPLGLTKCTNLTYLDLSGNSFIGSIPDNISSLVQLETLVLSSNNFSGHIPSSLKVLTKLSRFAINQNKLNGTIPKELSAIAGLDSLDLSYNMLSGSIPPQVFSLSNLKSLDLTSNSLSGEIPQNFSRSFYRLRLGVNHLTGSIPSTISNTPNLTYLEMNNNSLNGSIPKQLANCTKLQLLDLGHNGFGGSLAEVLPKLVQLQYIKLPNNKFEGNILDGLSNMPALTHVDLSYNLISEPISPKIFELPRLQNLRLQNNRLSGIIPGNIQDSKSLLELELGSNKLSGTIPQGLSNLYLLQIALNLSHNFLEGKIPSSLSNLVTLEILDLSSNSLTGDIPGSLSDMKSLTVLDLSYNKLIGIIPTSLLHNKNIVFNYTGNAFLTPEQSNQSSTKKKKLSAGLLAGAAVGGAIFALGAVGLTMLACKHFQYKEHEISEAQPPHVFEVQRVLEFVGARYWRRQRNNRSQAIRKMLQNLEHPRISYEDLLEATNRFHTSNLLASNSSGSVYKGNLADGTSVAVKVLNLMHEQSDKIFKAECKVLQKVRHRNLAKIITTCSTHQFKALIFEYFSSGSLEKHLYQDEYRFCRLGLKELLKIAIDVAHAVEYLHYGCYVQIVHCDIKPSNVLLDENLTAHLSDFGISRLMGRIGINSLTSTMDLRGSEGYIAPEYGLSGKMSPRGDVYSYGILLLEMLTRRRPTDSMFEGDVNLHKWVKMAFPDRAAEVVGEGFHVEECLISLMRVGLLCSGDSPEARPTMKEVCKLLKDIDQVWTPIKLRPTISNLVADRRAAVNCEGASDTQSSTF